MKVYLILFSLLFVSFLYAQEDSIIANPTDSIFHLNKEIPIYNFNELEPLLYTDNNKVYIVNFWAMWCAPCVRELPIIQEYEKTHPNVEVILVSLDFTEDIESKLKPFLKKKGITSRVVLLDDPDSNGWIDKVNPEWSGAIPFTIVFNNKNRSYHERPFESLEDLENVINYTIKNQ